MGVAQKFSSVTLSKWDHFQLVRFPSETKNISCQQCSFYKEMWKTCMKEGKITSIKQMCFSPCFSSWSWSLSQAQLPTSTARSIEVVTCPSTWLSFSIHQGNSAREYEKVSQWILCVLEIVSLALIVYHKPRFYLAIRVNHPESF